MSFKEVWKVHFQIRNFRLKFIFTIPALVILLSLLTNFLIYIETRSGIIFEDPFLSLFKPVDVTWFVFILNYTGLFLALAALSKNPPLLLTAIHAYMIMVLFRMLAMYSLPLEPPVNMIVLKDPLVSFFGGTEIYVKDLFFSGHTSTMFLLFLVTEVKVLKKILLLFAILVAGSVLVQHAHYSVDVIIAPFAAYASYMIALSLNRRI